jgi:hypothetical protein
MTGNPENPDNIDRRLERITNDLYGRGGRYKGFFEEFDHVKTEFGTAQEKLDKLTALAEEQMKKDAEREHASERRRRWVIPLILLFIGGVISSFFNLIVNVIQQGLIT